MKTAAKVFIWIGMILQFFLIYPIVIGIFALKKLDNPSSSSDLQTWGLLTVFFCSPIGGILMLSVKDSIPAANYYQQPTHMPVTTQEVIVEKQYCSDNDKKRFRAKTAVIVLMAMYTCLLIAATVFSVILICRRQRPETFVPLIISCLQIVSISFTFCAINIKALLKSVNHCLAITTFFSASQALYSLLLYILKYHKSTILYIAIASACALIFATISLVISIKTKQGTLNCKIVKTKTVVTINHMEVELAEAKRLLDTNVITQEEHDRIRSSIISKYYF